VYVFQDTLFGASLVLGSKKISSFDLFHSTHSNKPIKMRHNLPIPLFKCNPSFHMKQIPKWNFKLWPIFNTQNSMSHDCTESAANICGSCSHLMISYDCQLCTERVKCTAQIGTVQSVIICVCVVKGSEVTKLYTWSYL